MAARAGFEVQSHARAQDGIFSFLGNALAGADETPQQTQWREQLGRVASIAALIAIALTITFVTLGLLALAEGATADFVVSAIMGFVCFDSFLFCNKLQSITQHPINFVTLVDGQRGRQERMMDIMRAAAEPTLLLKHIIALC
jgi:hypothetical protein